MDKIRQNFKIDIMDIMEEMDKNKENGKSEETGKIVKMDKIRQKLEKWAKGQNSKNWIEF